MGVLLVTSQQGSHSTLILTMTLSRFMMSGVAPEHCFCDEGQFPLP